MEVAVDELDKPPGDLVTIAEAARAVDRSRDTVRRWLRTGALRRWEGARPAHGGSPPVLVSLAELHTLAVVAELEPEPARRGPVPPAGDVDEVAELRAALVAERHRGELADLRAELGRVTAERDGALRELASARSDLTDARAERDHWRELAAASTAERTAIAALAGVPWWRRLIGG